MKKKLLLVLIFVLCGMASTYFLYQAKLQTFTVYEDINRIKTSLDKEVNSNNSKLSEEKLKEQRFISALLHNKNYVEKLISNGERLGYIVDKRLKNKKDLFVLMAQTNNELKMKGMTRLSDYDIRRHYELMLSIVNQLPPNECVKFSQNKYFPNQKNLTKDEFIDLITLSQNAIFAEVDNYPPRVAFTQKELEEIQNKIFHEIEKRSENMNKQERDRLYHYLNSPAESSNEEYCQGLKFVLSVMLDSYEPDILRLDLISSLEHYLSK